MTERRVGLIMNGVTGRMGTNQHLIRSIAAIRADTEHVAEEIDSVEKRVGAVDDQLATFRNTAAEFTRSLAA